jgi:protocatechuate 3,4-dioxygenase beta subunit
MHIIEVRCCTYYLSSIHFTDDPLLTGADREEAMGGRGGNSLVTPRRDENGIWIVTRDIHLGQGVPGYPGRSRQAP